MRSYKHSGRRPSGCHILSRGLALAIVAAFGTACKGSEGVVDAPAPAVTADSPDSLPALPLSIVDAPISYEIAPAVAALEKAVPRIFGDIEKRIQMGSNTRAHFAFEAKRSPFQIAVNGQNITLTSVIEYEGRGWFRPPIGPTVSAACGTGDGVARPRARVSLATSIDLTPNWKLASRSRLRALEPFSNEARDECRVTAFRIDVTDRVMNATRGQMTSQLAVLDRRIAQVDVRKNFQQWWSSMARPIRLTDSIWLLINPSAVQLGKVSAKDGDIVANLRLFANPRIVTGIRPNDSTVVPPLPSLTDSDGVGDSLRVYVEGTFQYDVASNLLKKALLGRKIKQANRTLQIQDVVLSGIGGGRVAMAIRFDGDAKGQVFFTGTPQLDPATAQVFVPDLDYDVGSADVLVQGLGWLKDAGIRDFLRERARLPATDLMGELRKLAERGMNRDLTKGVSLVARLSNAQGIAVRATREQLIIRAQVVGQAGIEISKAPEIGKKSAPRKPVEKKG